MHDVYNPAMWCVTQQGLPARWIYGFHFFGWPNVLRDIERDKNIHNFWSHRLLESNALFYIRSPLGYVIWKNPRFLIIVILYGFAYTRSYF